MEEREEREERVEREEPVEREEAGPCWVDGALVSRVEAVLPATDSAFSQGRGCFTTARFSRGRARFAERHAARLVRDARRLELGEVDPDRVLAALAETGINCFGREQDGVIRVQASRDGAGALHLTAVPHHLGPEPSRWRACTAPFPHEGPMPWSGAKVTNHLLFALASDHAKAAGLDEALLFDRDGNLVEGARSNVIVVGQGGVPATPDLARGGVAGVALEVLREREPAIRVRNMAAHDLNDARELIAINAVRGPRAIIELDGRAVGDGVAGEWTQRLAKLFDED